jgi:DNA-binding transcriptional ArsR family regulator
LVLVDALSAISEPTRREILRLVWEQELPAGRIADRFPQSFGAISQHLGVLREAGLVTMRADGNRRLYRADRARLGPLAAVLEAMWSDSLERLAQAAEADAEAQASARRRRGDG